VVQWGPGIVGATPSECWFSLRYWKLTTRERTQRAKPLTDWRMRMYHPIRVCTPHQILRVALPGRDGKWDWQSLQRLFCVRPNTRLQPLLVGLTLATAQWLKQQGAKVLFASATLPTFLREILVETLVLLQTTSLHLDPSKAVTVTSARNSATALKSARAMCWDNLPQVVAGESNAPQQTTLIVCNQVANKPGCVRAFP